MSGLLNSTSEAKCCCFGKGSITPATPEQMGGGMYGKASSKIVEKLSPSSTNLSPSSSCQSFHLGGCCFLRLQLLLADQCPRFCLLCLKEVAICRIRGPVQSPSLQD